MDTLASRLIASTDCLDWSSINIKQRKSWLIKESRKQRSKSPSHFCWNCSGCSYSKGLLGFTTDLYKENDYFSQEWHSMAEMTILLGADTCAPHTALNRHRREKAAPFPLPKKKESKVHLQKYSRRSLVFQTLPSVSVNSNQSVLYSWKRWHLQLAKCPPTQYHSHAGFKLYRLHQVHWWSCRHVLVMLKHSKQGPKFMAGCYEPLLNTTVVSAGC